MDILPKIVSLTKILFWIPCNEKRKCQNLFSEEQEAESFSIFSSENCNEHQDFIIDSGATIYMIKGKSTFADHDENFSGIIHNANKTHSSNIRKRGC